ncbi:NADH-quinone oxidoreductase subunit N [Candidatus Terasakiella magnetica]|uniref:NADH-quinone oxidoreductase subunit N n=1 Tax=Candidatus Terasakiella magnetica TaxID=1867952 RepID=A0A1C3RCK6_9PROT|nr:NADH-quinone oxidoreductase subunit NuoN [Candidatus Terasakiella magnetica]SCA55001.1 NADH-quinone oxidoreductase subunit N [Candidatus Terasakiella magnetica]
MSELPNLTPALPEIFMACVAMALLMVGVFMKGEAKAVTRTVSLLATGSMILALLLVTAFSTQAGTTFNGLFITGAFPAFAKVLILAASAVTLFMSRDFFDRVGVHRFEFPVLAVLATLGMMMMVSANDLIALYMGLELQSLSLYVMASIMRNDLKSTESGLKYFVLGALASGMLLYGSSLVYGFAGTTNFGAMADILAHETTGVHGPSTGLIFGIVFVMVGLAFKVSAAPFHMWTPDVYEGAPTPVTAFFAAAPKVAALSLFIFVMVGAFGDLAGQWQQVVKFIAVASMVIGAFAAVAQTNIKRLMAYSSIGNVGYMLVGLAVGGAVASGTEVQQNGIESMLVYLTIYVIMTLGTFGCILAMKRNGQSVENINDLAGLSKSNPLMAAALAIFMFSMAGIPPLAGFFGKLYVFLAALEAGLVILAVIGVLSSVVGCFYYIRLIKIMYFDDAEEALDRKAGTEINLVVAAAAIVILAFFIYPSLITDSAASAAASLFAG